jgi:hypothetical protein
MKFCSCVYVSFCGDACEILGRISAGSDDVCDDADAVCSLRMVVLCAMQELGGKRVSVRVCLCIPAWW